MLQKYSPAEIVTKYYDGDRTSYYLCTEADKTIADLKAFALDTQRLMGEKILLLIERDARIAELENRIVHLDLESRAIVLPTEIEQEVMLGIAWRGRVYQILTRWTAGL